MGCDIHFVIEQRLKVRGEHKWVGVQMDRNYNFEVSASFVQERSSPLANLYKLKVCNYRFFGKLANVRMGDVNGENPRGIPDDASDLAISLIDGWGEDGHSHSWHTLEEFVRKYLLSATSDAIVDMVKERLSGKDPVREFFYINNWSDFRVIFWFDD